MFQQLIWLLVVGVAVGIIWWVCDYLPVPEPLNKLIKILSVVVGAIMIMVLLMRIAGMAVTI